MDRLDKAIKAAQARKGVTTSSGSSANFGKDRMGKAMSLAKGRIGDLRKAARSPSASADLSKGAHDAMFHHAMYAAAANRACKYDDQVQAKKCKDAAKKHTFMFLRHALENARDRDAWAMKNSLQRALNYYEQEASDEVYSGSGNPEHAAMEHFKNGGEFVADPDDGAFVEDYDSNPAGPNTDKKGK